MQAPAAAPSDLARLDAQARNPGPVPAQAGPMPHPETPAKPAAVLPAEKAHELTVKPEQTRLASVVAPPLRQTTVVPPPPAQSLATFATLTPPPRELGEFTVQVGASRDRTEAARLEARARGAGLKPYVLEANLGAKGTWYRVRVGAFRDKDAATRFRTDVERELRSAAVVMTTH
jgi:cell division septation protein DedD